MRAKRPAANTQSTAVVAPNIRSASKKAAAKIKEEADDADSGDEGSIAEGESDEEGDKPKKKAQIGKKRAAPF